MSRPKHAIVNNNFKIDVNSKAFKASEITKIAEDIYQVMCNDRSVKTIVVHGDFQSKSYVINVNNKEYEVCIHDELDDLIQNIGYDSIVSKKVDSICAPIPGIIVEVAVKPGQEVKENDSLVTLEAMKMENNIVAPQNGVIKKVSVQVNETVKKNQVLIEFE